LSFRQAAECGGILGRLCQGSGETGHKGERIRQRHPWRKTGGGRGRIDCRKKTPSSGIGDRRNRDLVSRCGGVFPL
jgi:hypothetical protein